jgi:hypothetical protein
MINLAGNPECDDYIRNELLDVGIPVIESTEPNKQEVNSKVYGKLGPFTFTRAWYYYVVKGPIPLPVAQEMYVGRVGKRDVRVVGHCGCPPPDQWAEHFNSEGKRLTKTNTSDHKLVLQDPSTLSKVMKDLREDIIEQYCFVDDPAKEAIKSIVDSYHIDSMLGLKLFVDTIKKHGLDL